MKKFNFYLGTTVSAWLLAVLVIVAELIEPFKNLLKIVFTHHWIAKAILITLAFLISGFLFKDKVIKDKLAWNSVILSLIIILLFYIFEYFI